MPEAVATGFSKTSADDGGAVNLLLSYRIIGERLRRPVLEKVQAVFHIIRTGRSVVFVSVRCPLDLCGQN